MSKECKYCVYAIRSKTTGRVYVGCTTDVERRIYQHFQQLKGHRKGKSSNVNHLKSGDLWQADYDKYGKSDFEVYVLEEDILYSERRTRERYWIRYYKATDKEYGYNAQGMKKEVPEIKVGIPTPKHKEAQPDGSTDA